MEPKWCPNDHHLATLWPPFGHPNWSGNSPDQFGGQMMPLEPQWSANGATRCPNDFAPGAYFMLIYGPLLPYIGPFWLEKGTGSSLPLWLG